MIQALKTDPNSSATGQAPSKEPRTPDPSFDPMLATLVAQMLGSLQQAPPQGAAPFAPRPESVQRAEAPSGSRATEAMASSRSTEKVERRTPRREDAPAAEARASVERAERPQAERPDAKPAPDPKADKAPEAPIQPMAEAPQELQAGLGPALSASESLATEVVAQEAAPSALNAPAAKAEVPRLLHAVSDERAPLMGDRPTETKAPVVIEALSQKVAPQGEQAVQALPTTHEEGSQGMNIPVPREGGPAAPSKGHVETPKTGPGPGPGTVDTVPVTPAAAETLPSVLPAVAPVGTRPSPELRAPEPTPVKPAASTLPVAPVAAVAVTAVTSGRESGSTQTQAQAPKTESRIQAVGTLHAPVAGTAPQRTQTFTVPAATTQAPPHPVLTQVDGTIRWILRKQEQGADLQLHPESLGKIQIKLTVEGQQVHAQVWASEPSTLPILRENLAFLEVSLQEQGLSLGNFQLHQGDRGQDAAFAQQPTHTSGLAGGITAPEPLQEVPLSVPMPLLGTYRIEVIA